MVSPFGFNFRIEDLHVQHARSLEVESPWNHHAVFRLRRGRDVGIDVVQGDVTWDSSVRQSFPSIFGIRSSVVPGRSSESANTSSILKPLRGVFALLDYGQLVVQYFFGLRLLRFIQRSRTNDVPRWASRLLLQWLSLRQFLVVTLLRYFHQFRPVDGPQRLIGKRGIVPA